MFVKTNRTCICIYRDGARLGILSPIIYNYLMTQDTYKKLVWDYQLSQDDFNSILLGEKKVGTFDQDWAISRILENLNYYDAMALVPYATLRERWAFIKGKLFNSAIKDGYEFLLQRYPVSIAG